MESSAVCNPLTSRPQSISPTDLECPNDHINGSLYLEKGLYKHVTMRESSGMYRYYIILLRPGFKATCLQKAFGQGVFLLGIPGIGSWICAVQECRTRSLRVFRV